MRETPPVESPFAGPVSRASVAQVAGIVVAPIALLTGLQVKYTLVELWACKSPAGPVVLHLVALVTLAITVGAGVVAHRQWRLALRADPGDPDGREGRTRTLAALGVGSSALSAFVVLSQWLPQFFLSPCMP